MWRVDDENSCCGGCIEPKRVSVHFLFLLMSEAIFFVVVLKPFIDL
jgi:hypothetical protein